MDNDEINYILDEIHLQPRIYDDFITAIENKAEELCADDLTNYIVDYTDFDNSVTSVKLGDKFNVGNFEIEFSESYPIYLVETKNPNIAVFGNVPYDVDFGFGIGGSTAIPKEGSPIFDLHFYNSDYLDENGISLNDFVSEAAELGLSKSQTKRITDAMRGFINEIETFFDVAAATCNVYQNVALREISTQEEYDAMEKVLSELDISAADFEE